MLMKIKGLNFLQRPRREILCAWKIRAYQMTIRPWEEKGGPHVFPVSPIMLLKTHVEKMSLSRFTIMFMKTEGLTNFSIMLLKLQQVRHTSPQAPSFCHYVHEAAPVSGPGRATQVLACVTIHPDV
jgi:hypothetical protein